MIGESSYKWIAAALLCTTLVSGGAALYLNNRVNTLQNDYGEALEELEAFTATVDILIDYGNGTAVWFNGTRVGAGESLLNATLRVAEVEYQVSAFGAFVNAVDGVSGVEYRYWIWSYYDGGWQMGSVGADAWRLHDGDVVSWVYASFS